MLADATQRDALVQVREQHRREKKSDGKELRQYIAVHVLFCYVKPINVRYVSFVYILCYSDIRSNVL
jgi:hypothetical protein